MSIKRSNIDKVKKLTDMSIIPMDFKSQGEIPLQFHFENENEIPRFTIRNVPAETQSLAIVMEDIDAPGGVHIHWIVYNIDPKEEEIGGELVFGETGKNTWTMKEYQGANPIKGKHHYRFTLYALHRHISILDSYTPLSLRNEIVESSTNRAFVEAFGERLGKFAVE